MNWQAISIGLVLVGMAANLIILIMGKPKSMQQLNDKLDELSLTLKVLMSQTDVINKQLKAQWEKIDLHAEMLVEYGKQIAVIKDRCDRRTRERENHPKGYEVAD